VNVVIDPTVIHRADARNRESPMRKTATENYPLGALGFTAWGCGL
jgi:hypothetical protein